VVWLEAWLRRQPATVLVISHDREFLDRIARRSGTSTRARSGAMPVISRPSSWPGSSSRTAGLCAKAYARTAAHLQSFVDRFRAKATKARQRRAG